MSKPCNRCGQPIEWKMEGYKEDGRPKYIPYNPDGTRHNCRSQSPPVKANGPSLSSEMEGRVRQIAREVAEQVFKENTGT